MKKYLFELIVFFSGAIVMILEVVGSRVLAPYLGTSIFIWTSLIGIILASLSLGYYLGGRLSDRSPSLDVLATILFFAAILIGITTYVKTPFLNFLLSQTSDLKLGSVIATVVLFALPSTLLGMVSPYCIKLRLKSLTTSGSTVGNLYAISTIGSIAGTFCAGFYLIPLLGTTTILFLLAITLMILSIVAYAKNQFFLRTAILFGLIVLAYTYESHSNIIEVDTKYNKVWIYSQKPHDTSREKKIMQVNRQKASTVYTDTKSTASAYVKYFDLAKFFKQDVNKALILGGAGYEYPRHFLTTFPDATIDVVEIDPKLTNLARKHFYLKDNPRLSIHHMDGRIFLNQMQQQYDVIYGNAFNSVASVPYHLTTLEAARQMKGGLKQGGVACINVVSSLEGAKSKFFRAEYKTFKAVFNHIYLFPVQYPDDPKKIQNIIIFALKGKPPESLTSKSPKFQKYLDHYWNEPIETDLPVLTDNHAPVDYYLDDITE